MCVRLKKEKEIDEEENEEENEEEAFMVDEFYKVKRVFHTLGGELYCSEQRKLPIYYNEVLPSFCIFFNIILNSKFIIIYYIIITWI